MTSRDEFHAHTRDTRQIRRDLIHAQEDATAYDIITWEHYDHTVDEDDALEYDADQSDDCEESDSDSSDDERPRKLTKITDTSCYLDQLPPNIRRQIFELAIGNEFAYVKSRPLPYIGYRDDMKKYFTSYPRHGILFACKRFYAEALPIYYLGTTFVVFCVDEGFIARTTSISPTLVTWLQRLQLAERGLEMRSIRVDNEGWQVWPGFQTDSWRAIRRLDVIERALENKGIMFGEGVVKLPMWTECMVKVWMTKSELVELEEKRSRNPLSRLGPGELSRQDAEMLLSKMREKYGVRGPSRRSWF